MQEESCLSSKKKSADQYNKWKLKSELLLQKIANGDLKKPYLDFKELFGKQEDNRDIFLTWKKRLTEEKENVQHNK